MLARDRLRVNKNKFPDVRDYYVIEETLERYEKALVFYADVSKYPAPLTGGMGELWSDCGAVAREALGRDT